uniref:Syndecan n=1 Tax=Stegastes partitus TaxID=144197 RepID=A0A3B5ASM4_9TELE
MNVGAFWWFSCSERPSELRPVFMSQQVRETETWMPMKTTQTVAMSTHGADIEASGDSPNGSDFGFTDDEDDEEYNGYDENNRELGVDDYDDEGGFNGSASPDVNDNKIPEPERPVRPTVNEVDLVWNSNEIPVVRNEHSDEYPSNVLMSHAGDDSIFNKTEVLAALIAGGAVGLMFAVLLILFLIYRMKKKDEGSYDLGKKPIYKKAPTTEIYA